MPWLMRAPLLFAAAFAATLDGDTTATRCRCAAPRGASADDTPLIAIIDTCRFATLSFSTLCHAADFFRHYATPLLPISTLFSPFSTLMPPDAISPPWLSRFAAAIFAVFVLRSFAMRRQLPCRWLITPCAPLLMIIDASPLPLPLPCRRHADYFLSLRHFLSHYAADAADYAFHYPAARLIRIIFADADFAAFRCRCHAASPLPPRCAADALRLLLPPPAIIFISLRFRSDFFQMPLRHCR